MAWTEERKQKHREMLQRCKPWEKSTGPKTHKGKIRSRMNALKEGGRTRKEMNIKKAMRHNHAFIRAILAVHETEARYDRLTNELLKNPSKSGL